MKPLVFAGGGGKSYNATADTLATNDTVEVLLGISEGPIAGPINGAQSFYLDDTPLINPNGEPNFSAFTLDFWLGNPLGDSVAMLTGGFSSPTQINQPLYYNAPVTRQGLQTEITAVDFNVVINSLEHSDTNGTGLESLQIRFEYCPQGGTFQPCFTSSGSSTPLTQSGATSYEMSQIGNDVSSFSGDRPILQYSNGLTSPTQQNAIAIDASGNVYQWNTGSSAWVQAILSSGIGGYADWNDVQGSTTIARRVYTPSTTPPLGARAGDIWVQSLSNAQYLIFNGTTWVTPNNYYSYTPTQQSLDGGVWAFTGKITNPTTITVRCFIPKTDTPYQYRVTKLVRDDTTTDFTDVTWESFSEVKQTSWNFYSLSMLHVLGQASDQFTSLPTWTADCEGKIVNIPSNYDPVARTYTGVWDGTYKAAYTNNPAWVFKDFVENTTYGLSSIYPHVCNPWSLYNFSQFCDVLVPTLAGGMQPRWTYNDYVTQPRDAREMANYIAGAACGLMVDDGAGYVDVLFDDPSAPAVMLFTPENVSPDGFKYSYTDRLTRANQVIVSFANPEVNWQTDKRIEADLEDIATYGLITDDIVAVGCIDPDEALRRARYRLISGLTETEFVTFTTNRKGKYLSPWNVILISDPTLGRGLSGRISSVIDSSTVSLRDPITLENGFTYTAWFDIPNPNYQVGNNDLSLIHI